MSPNEIKRRFPNASEKFIRLNAEVPSRVQDPKPQPALLHDTLATHQRKEEGSGRCKVSIISYRTKLCDLDNLWSGTKFLNDALKVCGLIEDDSPNHIILEVRQEKVAHRNQEHTVVEIG